MGLKLSVCLSVCKCASLFRKVMMDSVGRLFRVHTHLATQGWSPPVLLDFFIIQHLDQFIDPHLIESMGQRAFLIQVLSDAVLCVVSPQLCVL